MVGCASVKDFGVSGKVRLLCCGDNSRYIAGKPHNHWIILISSNVWTHSGNMFSIKC